jgi:hypothetical protein
MKKYLSALALLVMACGAPTEEDINIGTLEQESGTIQTTSTWLFGTRVDNTSASGKQYNNCVTTQSSSAGCLIPAHTFVGPQQINGVYIEAGGDQHFEGTLGTLDPLAIDFVELWISDNQEYFENYPNGASHAFTRQIAPALYQVRIGKGAVTNTADWTKTNTYFKLQLQDCDVLWETQPGIFNQCDIVRVFIDTDRINTGATWMVNQGHSASFTLARLSLLNHVVNQALWTAEGVGTTGTTSVMDPMRRTTVPLAPFAGFMSLTSPQNCMMAKQVILNNGGNLVFNTGNQLAWGTCP